jgi:hypothetical protein
MEYFNSHASNGKLNATSACGIERRCGDQMRLDHQVAYLLADPQGQSAKEEKEDFRFHLSCNSMFDVR